MAPGGVPELSWRPLGRLLGRLGGILGPSWSPLGPSWGRLGASWGHFGPSWGHLEAVLKLSWAFREPCSRLQERILAIPKNLTKTIVFLLFSTIKTIGFQRFWPSGTRLKAFWGSLEPSWRRFGRRLDPLGTTPGAFAGLAGTSRGARNPGGFISERPGDPRSHGSGGSGFGGGGFPHRPEL